MPLLATTILLLSTATATPRAGEQPTVVVRQSGEADLVGDDDEALEAALARLRPGGGTLVIGPGRYVMRRMLFLPEDVTVVGEDGAVLALPSPNLLAEETPAGGRELTVAGEHEYEGGTRVQLLPPIGLELFPDGKTESLELRVIERVEGRTLVMNEPLPFALPAGSRVGYPHKLLWVHKAGKARIENLAFEGGRVPEIPMPGHSQRCAIWASAPFGFEEERIGPPGTGIEIVHCRFSDLYGRGVALYNHEDGRVEGCLFERISDEAIDLDHYVEGFRIVGNEVRDALWGIVLNDAARNLVEYNNVSDVEIGIWCWRYEKIPASYLNEENVVRHNVVRRARDAAIHFDVTCVRNVIEQNFVEGEIRVLEEDNVVRSNTQLDAGG